MSQLTTSEKKNLLLLARQSVEQKLFDRSDIQPDLSSKLFHQVRGAFVTIHISGALRGCIGIVEAMNPLVDVIRDMAKASAFRDPRFPPLTKEEYPLIDFEISVLSVPQKLDTPDNIVIGKHGLIISLGSRRGLLLPQVATDNHWDRETFLNHTCRKASLPEDSWKHDATIESFEAEVFSEHSINTTTNNE